MKKLLYAGLVAIIIIAAAYYFWTEIYVFIPQEALARSNIHSGEILHSAKVEDGFLIFYRDPADTGNVCVAYEKCGLTGWRYVTGGGAAVKEDNNDLSWCRLVLKQKEQNADSPIEWAVLFGEISNPAIAGIKVMANIETEKMKIKKPVIEEQAQIIECGKTRLWLVMTDKDMSTMMKICAYSASGELLYTGNDWEAPIPSSLR